MEWPKDLQVFVPKVWQIMANRSHYTQAKYQGTTLITTRWRRVNLYVCLGTNPLYLFSKARE